MQPIPEPFPPLLRRSHILGTSSFLSASARAPERASERDAGSGGALSFNCTLAVSVRTLPRDRDRETEKRVRGPVALGIEVVEGKGAFAATTDDWYSCSTSACISTAVESNLLFSHDHCPPARPASQHHCDASTTQQVPPLADHLHHRHCLPHHTAQPRPSAPISRLARNFHIVSRPCLLAVIPGPAPAIQPRAPGTQCPITTTADWYSSFPSSSHPLPNRNPPHRR